MVRKAKKLLDDKMPKGTERWVLHDLRSTARSLMSRAGVRPDLAERTLGHAIKGVEGTYDRYNYSAEKGGALACCQWPATRDTGPWGWFCGRCGTFQLA